MSCAASRWNPSSHANASVCEYASSAIPSAQALAAKTVREPTSGLTEWFTAVAMIAYGRRIALRGAEEVARIYGTDNVDCSVRGVWRRNRGTGAVPQVPFDA